MAKKKRMKDKEEKLSQAEIDDFADMTESDRKLLVKVQVGAVHAENPADHSGLASAAWVATQPLEPYTK
jgi:ABC-type phosphonate transport system ATPase subunit